MWWNESEKKPSFGQVEWTHYNKINIDCRQLYYIHLVGGMDFNAKLKSKMELLLPKIVGEGLALLLVTTMLLGA